ncbi:hypothetical protein AJ80_08200 [Polytolypa hystricis UAMH7299]|uniref:Uncharacterized protein n=1 Tax=Polytolypa hystricis (strain UAMH7299) TaxID=1447883 RepID=A0A2B7XBT4_POLH7|nr:hypothetical protein AJ80_08200 [Polytolypa hystricis UAMH7299]
MLLRKATSLTPVLLVISIWACSVHAKDDDLNVYGGSGPNVLCVFPISGPYNFLQRLLFYVLLVFAVLARRQKWLVFGALASAMSYSGAAAIHGLLLVSGIRTPIDLDVYGVFAVTASGVMLTAPLLNWSTTLIYASKRHRYIVMLWGGLLLLGATVTVASIFVNEARMIAPSCRPKGDVSPSQASLFSNPTEDCVYTCSPQRRLFRPPNDVQAWPNHIGRARDIVSVFMPTTYSYILTWAIVGIVARTCYKRKISSQCPEDYNVTASSTKDVLGLRRIGTFLSEQDRKSTTNSSVATEKLPPRPQQNLSRMERFWLSFRYYLMLGHFAAFITNVVMTEYRLKDLPNNEQPYEVGQWAPWVSVALVVLAQAINRFARHRWGDEGLRCTKKRPDEEQAAASSSPFHQWRLGTGRGPQTSGDTLYGETGGVDEIDMKVSRTEAWSTKRRNSF